MSKLSKQPNVVTIGGGTGTFTVLSGLKEYPINIAAIVAMSDDGGSSGRLRTKLGVLPPGDARQALIALSSEEDLMLELLKYRFKESELRGHNLGNLILGSLEKITGDFEKGIKAASKLFQVKGKVIPVTTEQTQLKVRVDTGEVVIGETIIDDEPPKQLENAIVKEVELDPAGSITKSAEQAIMEADYIIIGPGDFWGSIIANLIVKGVSKALNETKAKKIFVANLMTRWGQKGFSVQDYVTWIERFCPVDYIMINNASLPADVVEAYSFDNEYPVEDDITDKKYSVIRDDLMGTIQYTQDTADEIKRSLLRHDAHKVANAIINTIIHA